MGKNIATNCSQVTVLVLAGWTKKSFGHYAILKHFSLRSPSIVREPNTFFKFCRVPTWESYFWREWYIIPAVRKSMLEKLVSWQLPKYWPLKCGARKLRLCGTMWFKLGDNWRSSIKNQFTHPDSASIIDENWSKSYGDLMHPGRVITPQSSKNGLASAFSRT